MRALLISEEHIHRYYTSTDLYQRILDGLARLGRELPILGSYLLVGDDIKTKAYNLRRKLDEERVSLIEAVAVRRTSKH